VVVDDRVRVGDDHRIVVDVDDPGVGDDLSRHLMDALLDREARTDVEELPNSPPREEPYDPDRERSIPASENIAITNQGESGDNVLRHHDVTPTAKPAPRHEIAQQRCSHASVPGRPQRTTLSRWSSW
jgi:hypothetical protein